MAPCDSIDGVWIRKTEEIESTGRKNRKGKRNNRNNRTKKFTPLDVDITYNRSSSTEGEICRYDDSLVLESVPRDGFCIFHSVLRAQGSSVWGDSSLTLNKLLKLVEEEAMLNKFMYSCYLSESDQENFEVLLQDYLLNGSFNTVLGDMMPLILANVLNIKIKIVKESGKLVTVEPISAASSHMNKIFLKLNNVHYEPYVKMY